MKPKLRNTPWLILGILIPASLLLAGCLPQSPEVAAQASNATPNLATTVTPTLHASATPTKKPTFTPVTISTVALASVSGNCTYSPYYWEHNPDLWLTDNIVIGRFTFSKQQALEFMGVPSQDGTSLVLRQFLSAALNIIKGADAGPVEADLAEASVWLDTHPLGVELTALQQRQGMELASRLEAYNYGLTGPGQCTDEPVTPTPTSTMTPTTTPTRTPGPSPTNTARPTERTRDDSDSGSPAPQPTDEKEPEPEPTKKPPDEEPKPTEAPEEPTDEPKPTDAPPPPPEEEPPPSP